MHIKQSKTDPFRQGAHIYLGRTYKHICPVQAILSYLAMQDTHPAQCLFSLMAGCSELDKILGKLNLQTHQYNTHSFRIGAATSAKHTGMSDVLIKTLGRWQSDTYQRYIRTSHNNWPTYQGYCYLRHQDKQPDTLDKYKTLR